MKMKKIYPIIMLCAMSIALACCGDIKKSNNDSYDATEEYQEACASADFEKAHKILSSLHAKYLKSMSTKYGKGGWLDSEYAWTQCSEGRAAVQAAAEEYISAIQFIFTSEARLIIAEDDNPEDKIFFLYTEIRQVGTKHNETRSHWSNSNEECMQHIHNRYVECINSFSNSVLDMAIYKKNRRLAAIAVSHILDVYEGIEDKGWGEQVKVFYSDKEKVAAQKKFDNAVRNGDL